MHNFYIYSLKDPRDGRIYCVGQTVHPRQRLAQHLRLRFEKNPPKRLWISDLLNQKLKPEMVILQEGPLYRADPYHLERQWIDLLKMRGEPLTNLDRRVTVDDLLHYED